MVRELSLLKLFIIVFHQLFTVCVVPVIAGAPRGYIKVTLFLNFATTLTSLDRSKSNPLVMVRELAVQKLFSIVFHQLVTFVLCSS